jgi:drug/metabolite transporter (DMT)-like permease
MLFAFSVLAHVSLAVPNIHSLGALLASGIVCQLVGYFCLTYALGHLPATVTSVMLLAVAPLTALFALMTFGERMTALQSIGGLLVLVGVWIVTGSPRISSQPE